MVQEQLSPGRDKAFTFTEISEGVAIFKAHSYGNGHFIPGIPSEGLDVCFELKKFHDTIHIQIHDVNLFQWLLAIPSLRDGCVVDATPCSINMAHILPHYLELKGKFYQDKFKGLAFTSLQLFVLDFLSDRSIFAILGLEDLYQEETLTEVHSRDHKSWDWDYSMSKDLDCLDRIVHELHEYDKLDALDELDEPDEPDEPEAQVQEEPYHPVTLMPEPIRSELWAFIRQGDLEAVKRVLDMTPGPVDAETLCIAIEPPKLDIFRRLLENSAEMDGNGFSVPLCDAAKYGNKDAVELLLSHGANIERGVGGWTPLTHAACKGHLEIVQYLVDKQGADVNGTWFECPLSYAIENGHTRIVEYLLASGADVFKGRRPQYSLGYFTTPWSVENDPFCTTGPVAIWSYLLPRTSLRQFGSWFSDPDPHWLPHRPYTGNFERLVAECCAHTRYLLLSRAAADGDLWLVEYLVSLGVNVNSTEKESPLYLATKNRQPEIVRTLLEVSTDVQPAGVSDLLWCAAENADLDTIYLLLGCGPQLHLPLLHKLLSVTNSYGIHCRVKADGNVRDGFVINLRKDESFAGWDTWRAKWGDLAHLLPYALVDMLKNQSKKCGQIIEKLAAKISTVQKLRNAQVIDVEVTDLEDCPVVAAIQAQERRTIFRRLFAKIESSLKRLLHAGACQGASTGLVNFSQKAGTETSRAVWKLGTRVIRNIEEGCLPSHLPGIVSILQVANAMRSAIPGSNLGCSRKDFVNDIPKWAALLNEEDRLLFLEIAEHLWRLPPRVEIAPTPDTFSIWEDLKRLVNSLMRASGLFDHDFEHSSSRDRLWPLNQRHLPGMSPIQTYEGDPQVAEWRPPPASNIQETAHTNLPEPPGPKGWHSSIFRDIVYLMTGAVFGSILLFLYVHRYGYSTLSLPIPASYDRHGSDLDRIMNRNCVILSLYIGPTLCVSPGTWKRTDHLPVSTWLSPDNPEIVTRGMTEEHLAAFESRSEDAHTTIDSPDALDTAMEDALPSCSLKLQSQAPTSSSVTSVSPSTTNTATIPDLTHAAVSEDGFMNCTMGSCTSRFKPGKNQKGNYNKHLREQHFKEEMHKCRWEGCSWKKSIRYNVKVHEKTCKKRSNGNRADSGQRRRRLKGQPTGSNTRRTP